MAAKERVRAKHYKRQDQPGSHPDAGFLYNAPSAKEEWFYPELSEKPVLREFIMWSSEV